MDNETYDLELKNVVKTFNGTVAVKSFSLAVRHGEFMSLLGPSGCGKTTTLRLVAGFEAPDSGEILLKGKPVTDVAPNRRDVNTVFQHYALFPHLTVYQNIVYSLAIARRPKDEMLRRSGEMIEVATLQGLEQRYPHQLSGGQQQRVALARALINKPTVLLLDEPLGALDLKVRKRMQLELKRIQRTLGITFIYVTHDQEEALTLSDRIVVMNHGVLEQLDSPRQIYDHPKSRFVLDFVGSCNVFDGVIADTDGARALITVAPDMQVRAAYERSMHRGTTVTVGVRPEKIALSNERAACNSFPGVVTEVVFQGALCQFKVRLANQREVDVFRQTRDSDAEYLYWAPGREVWLSWTEENSIVVDG